MPNLLIPSIVEIWLDDPTGVRIELLDYCVEYEYANLANEPGPFRIRMPARFDRNKIKLDNIIEIWRGHGPGTLKLDYCGFLRAWVFADDGGNEYTELYGYSTMELMKRRVTGYLDYYSDNADDVIKDYVDVSMGATAVGDRDLTSVGGGFTIQADLADGASVDGMTRWDNLLDACTDIADASKQLGTPLYFDVVPIMSSSTTGTIAFQFQTFTDQRGNDRTWDSYKPVFLGPKWGNLQNCAIEFDHTEEVNYCYALGQGDGEASEVSEVSDTSRIESSIWNLREGAVDVGTQSGDADERTDKGNSYLDENKPRLRFSGNIVENNAFCYGRDWYFGDKCTISYAGYQWDAMISRVLVSRGSDGQESIDAALEVDE